MNLTLNGAIGSSGLSGAVLDVASLSLPPFLVAGAFNNLMTKVVADVVDDAARRLCAECGMPRFIGASIHRIAAKTVVLLIKPSTIEVDARVDRHTAKAIEGLTVELSARLIQAVLKHLHVSRIEPNGLGLAIGRHASGRWREALASSLINVMNQQIGRLDQLGRQVNETLNTEAGDFDKAQLYDGPIQGTEAETKILRELSLAALDAATKIAKSLLAAG